MPVHMRCRRSLPRHESIACLTAVIREFSPRDRHRSVALPRRTCSYGSLKSTDMMFAQHRVVAGRCNFFGWSVSQESKNTTEFPANSRFSAPDHSPSATLHDSLRSPPHGRLTPRIGRQTCASPASTRPSCPHPAHELGESQTPAPARLGTRFPKELKTCPNLPENNAPNPLTTLSNPKQEPPPRPLIFASSRLCMPPPPGATGVPPVPSQLLPIARSETLRRTAAPTGRRRKQQRSCGPDGWHDPERNAME